MGDGAEPQLLSVSIEDLSVLGAAYMPFVVNGGLFIPTPRRFALGDEVFVLLRLPDDPSGIPLAGHVVWITPPGARGGKEAGIGVQFNDRDNLVRQRIDALLGTLGGVSGRPSYTM